MRIRYLPADPAGNLTGFVLSPVFPGERAALAARLMAACPEGELKWVEKEKVPDLNLWEGDRIFLRLLLEREDFFSLKLSYRGAELTEAKIF